MILMSIKIIKKSLLCDSWLNRFKVFGPLNNKYKFCDKYQPDRIINASKFARLSKKELQIAFFQYGFLRSTITTIGQFIKQSPCSNALFWQFPCKTEESAYNRHINKKYPLLQNDELHIYLGLPWATLIDHMNVEYKPNYDKSIIKKQIQILKNYISGFCIVLKSLGIKLRIHTVCQHIYWKMMIPIWKELNVTDIWISHCQNLIEPNFTIHPWALYAVNVQDKQRRIGIQEGKDPTIKTILASFIGANTNDIRSQLLALNSEPGFIIKITDKWHFENVVRQQIEKSILTYNIDNTVEDYNKLLSDSVFSLCPVGTGSNTLRLWESLAVGSIPVLFSQAALMPCGGNLPIIDWDKIVIRISDDQIKELPQLLRSISMDEIRIRQNLAMEAYKLVCDQCCF